MKVIENKCLKETACIHCGSRFIVNEKKDLFMEYFEYGGCQHFHYFLYCPCCGEKIVYKTDID